MVSISAGGCCCCCCAGIDGIAAGEELSGSLWMVIEGTSELMLD